MRPTAPLLRRTRLFALTTKRVPNGFYKGNRTGKMGEHTARGGYRVNYDLVRTYVPPAGLADFALTPFVTAKVSVAPGRVREGTGPLSGAEYLKRWKAENAFD